MWIPLSKRLDMGLGRLRGRSTDEISEQLRQFVDAVKPLTDVSAVILFGSAARDQLTDASDIDLAILISDICDQKAIKSKLNEYRKAHISWPVDMVIMKRSWFEQRRSFGGLCMEIDADAKWLYSNENGG